MKRIASIAFVCIFLFVLSVQVFAVETRPYPGLRSKVDACIEKFNGRIPVGYDYVAVLSDGTYTYLYYSMKPIINRGDKVCLFTDRQGSAYNGTFQSIGVDNFSVIIQIGVNYRVFYYVTDRSTAIVNGLDSAFETSIPTYDSFVTVGEETDLSRLQLLISQANQKQETAYTTETWITLQVATNDAKAMTGGTPTQVQVDAMCDRLQAALDGLQLKPPPLPDTTELEELLAYAKSIKDEGYTPSSWSRLQAAIDAGDALLASASYTEEEVSEVTSNLRNAISALALEPPTEPSTEPTVPTDPPTVPTSPPRPPDPGDHRYMVDGFRVEDLMPAQEAIMENFGEARKFGIFVFVSMIVLFIITRLIRRMIGFEAVSCDDSGVLTSHTREVILGHGFRGHHPNEIKKGSKYIDY